MAFFIHGTVDGTPAWAAWHAGTLLGTRNVLQVIHVVADIDDVDLGDPVKAAAAAILSFDDVRQVKLLPTG